MEVCLVVESGAAEVVVDKVLAEQMDGFGEGIEDESLIKLCPKVSHQCFGEQNSFICIRNQSNDQI